MCIKFSEFDARHKHYAVERHRHAVNVLAGENPTIVREQVKSPGFGLPVRLKLGNPYPDMLSSK